VWTRQDRSKRIWSWSRCYLDRYDIGSKWSQDDIWLLGMIVGFPKVEGIIDWNRNRINLYRNTQILILEFE